MSRLTSNITHGIETARLDRLESVLLAWEEANTADLNARFGSGSKTTTKGVIGGKYVHFVIGSSSAFLVDIATGIIYGNKGWLKVDKSKIVGNAYDPNFNAAVLIRDRFRYGHFENAQDGSLRQPIVRR